MVYIICFITSDGFSQTLCSQFASTSHTVTLNGTYNDHVVWSHKVILVEGNVVFNKGVYFNNCTIKVTSGVLLTFTESPVGFNYSTRILNSKIFSNSCSQMYTGFKIMPRRNFVFTNNEIEDAVWAVTASNGSTLTLENNEFSRNFNSIRLHKLSDNYPPNVLVNKFSNNSITCPLPLNQIIYWTPGSTPTDRSFTGVEVKDMSIRENFGLNATSVNLFEDLHIGMLIEHSNVSIENCSFENMVQLLHQDAQEYPIGGFGLYSSLSEIDIKGLGSSPTSPATFQNCDVNHIRSIADRRLNVNNSSFEFNKDVQDQIQVLHEGIKVYGGNDINLEIYGNAMTYQELKAPLENSYFSNSIIKIENTKMDYGRIQNNRIFYNCLVCPTATKEKLRTIYLLNCPKPSTGFCIRNNTIDRYDYLAPMIAIENCDRIDIYDNIALRWDILLSQANEAPKPAILIQGGGFHNLANNRITGKHKNGSESIGIKISGSVNDSLCYNKQTRTNTGVLVEGASTGFNLSENQFDDLGKGLYYVNGTLTMRENNHKANFWTGAFVNEEARHDGNTFPFNSYRSKRNNYGTSIKYWPNPLVPNNNRWFIDRINENNENLIGCPVLPGPDLHHWTPMLDDDFEDLTNPVQRWQVYKDFYDYVVENDLESSLDSLELLFLYIQDSTHVPEFVRCISSFRSIYSISNQEQLEIQLVKNTLDSIYSELAVIDSMIYNSSEDWVDSVYLLRNIILADIQLELSGLDSLQQAIDSNQYDRLISSIACVDNLPEEEDYETDEKFCLQMILKYYSGENFDSSEVLLLEEIANSCINDRGNIVLVAQALVPDSLKFYRSTLWNCAEQEAQIVNTQKPLKNGMSIYPNPVTDHLFMEADLIAIKTIQIWELSGKRILHKDFDNNSMSTLDVSVLKPGYYILQVESSKGELEYFDFVKGK